MKKTVLLFVVIGLSFCSCSDDILDIEPTDRVSESAVWSDAALIRAFHNQIYSGIDDAKGPNPLAKATDEIAWNSENRYPGPVLNNTLNPDNVTDRANFRGGGSIYTWRKDYEVIREVLVFLDRMETDEVLQADERERLVAEARVIRAYMYFRLMVRFGGVPIITEVLDQNSEFRFSRNTMDEVVAYVETEIAEAMPDLPLGMYADAADFGRVNQTVGKAILSRMYLYMASPLFSASNDREKWQKAADAAFDIIDDGFFSLHPDYTTLFNAPSGSANNELIWARNYSATNAHDFPMYMLGRRWGAFGGWGGGGGPSQNLVDDFEMSNGEPPFIRANHISTGTVNPASGYDPQNPYANRDPRFYQSVNYDGTEFREIILEKWVASDDLSWGFDSFRESGDNPRSNYTMRKFMPGTDTQPILDFAINFTEPYHHFRLSEIYLNYAEAMFELGDEATCREYINLIRARPTVEMPPLPATITGEDLRDRLYNERRIELVFEEHRYFDVRRWRIAQFTESRNLFGMDIVKDIDTDVKTYTPVSLFNRAWDERLNFVPIERSDILISDGALEQTPGYN